MKKLILLLFLLVPLMIKAEEQDSIDKLINTQALKFKYILETAKQYHTDSLDFLAITDEVLKKMLQEFDVQSYYYTKKEVELFKENNTGKTFSPGIDIQKIQDTVTIINIVENSSAASAGLMLGDKIIDINGKDYKEESLNYIKTELSGDSATKLSLKIFRKYDNSEFDVEVERLDVETPSVTAAFLLGESKTGYIKINRFSELADDEFISKSENLLQKGLKRLIIDLRGNSGGSLDASSAIIDQFLPEGKLLAYTESKNESFRIKKMSTKQSILSDIPVVLLVDENSASGAELIAAAIQDYDRGIVVGERTFGKGSIQKIWYMNDGSAFKLTVGEYHSPVGRNLQKPLEKEVELDESAQLQMDEAARKKILEGIKKSGGAKIETYESFGGRSLLGGGGVWPDQFALDDTLTTLTKVLLIKGVFNEFAIRYLAENRKELLDKFGDDFMLYVNEFNMTDEILQNFANLAVKEFNVWNKEMFEVDKTMILYHIKASIAHFLWGNDGYTATMLPGDKVFRKGINSLPEAEKLFPSN